MFLSGSRKETDSSGSKGSDVKSFCALLFIPLLLMLAVAQDGRADTWPPTLTVYDEADPPNAYTAPDNSTVFTIIPGGRCVFEIDGTPGSRYGLFFGLNTTGNMTGPFLATPFFEIQPGSPHFLDSQGLRRIPIMVPRAYITVSRTLYLQASVYDPNHSPSTEPSNGITFEIGIGLNTGEVVAGYMGSSKSMSYTVMGDTVNTASRFCSTAGARDVLIGENTDREVGYLLDLEKLPPTKLKGKGDHVDIYRVLGVKHSADPTETSPVDSRYR